MPGTVEGGKKAADTNRKYYGEEFYSIIGAAGGKVRNPRKGFGSDREAARRAGKVGGMLSSRRLRKIGPDAQ